MKKKLVLILMFLLLVCPLFATGQKYSCRELTPMIERFLQYGTYVKIGETYPRYKLKNNIYDLCFEGETLVIVFSDGTKAELKLKIFTFELDKNNNLIIN